MSQFYKTVIAFINAPTRDKVLTLALIVLLTLSRLIAIRYKK